MKKHFTEKLSAYVNHELPKEERQPIAEHLSQCETCRKEYDEIKFAATLATGNLKRVDAPQNTWNEIRNAHEEKKNGSLAPPFSFFNSHGLLTGATALLIVTGLAIVTYLNFFAGKTQEIADNNSPSAVQLTNNDNAQIVQQTLTETSAGSKTEIASNQADTNNKTQAPIQIAQNNSNQITPQQKSSATGASWQVETLSGAPTTGNQAISKNGKLTVGEFLETDADSRARVQVANIGQVEVAPNSRVRLVKTHATEHRLSLERGVLQARILAPPRLFIVDTPTAAAVDLGCEYTLEVDKEGNSKLHVTSGYVALERDGRESIVPAGAMCLTRRGKGIGTPFFDKASPALRAALKKFDFEGGGRAALQTVINESRSYDTLTLWHLLTRVEQNEREKVFDAIVAFVKLPDGVTREGVLKLNKKMLEQWQMEVENLWYE